MTGRLPCQRLMILAGYALMLLGDGMGTTVHCAEKNGIPDHAEINIEAIAYAGRDEYRIVIVLMNRSSHALTVREFGREFFVQTEKGWQRLQEAGPDGRKSGDIHLLQGKTKKIDTVVIISPAAEGLFRTYEGDISFMFAYRYTLAGNKETMKNERLYWIRPMTSTWIEREGM